MDYDTMKAGREMDALIAEKVMGWKDIRCDQGGNLPYGVPDDDFNSDVDEHKKHGNCGFPMEYHREPIPMYSHDISAAWEVVEKMTSEGACPAIINDDNGHWAMALDGMQNCVDGSETMDVATTFFAPKSLWCDTVPLAICRAALKAKEG